MHTIIRKISFVLIFLLSLSISIHAQLTENSHLSYKTKSNFCLPQFEIAVEMPANTGFLAKYKIKEKSLLNLKNDHVVSFLDTTTIGLDYNNYISFRFAHNDKYEYLELYIQQKQEKQTRAQLSQVAGFIDYIAPITTKLGKTVGYEIDRGGSQVALQYIEKGNYRFLFAYSANISTESETKVVDMIKSTFKRELPKDILFYNNRQGLKDLEKEIETTKAPITFNKVKEYKGRTEKETTFGVEEAGLSIVMPAETSYSLKGTSLDKTNNKIELKAEAIDPSERMNMMIMNHRDALFSIRIFYESEIQDWFYNMLMNPSYKLNEKLEVNIGGHNLPAVINRGDDKSYINTLNIYYQYDKKLVLLNFQDISQENITLIDKIIASIKLQLPEEKGSKEKKNLLETLKLSAPTEIQLDKDYNIVAPKPLDDIVTLNIPELHLTLGIWEKINQLKTRNNFEDLAGLKSTTIPNLPKTTGDSYTITNYEADNGMTIYIERIAKEDRILPETELKASIRSYLAFKDMKIVNACIKENKNTQWIIFVSHGYGQYSAQIKTYIGGYRLSIFLYDQNLDSLHKRIGIIDTFSQSK